MRTLIPLAAALLALVAPTTPPAAPAAQRAAPNERPARFSHGEVELAGTLLVPPGPGPFPGVVIVHGSGDSTRENPWTAAWAAALAERGIAVLHPDKRGCGASAGDWRRASLLDLADDALAGVEWLAGQPEVAADAVGVIGFSQGGQVVPAAAARSPRVAFAASVSGALVPLPEQAADEVLLMARRAGLGDDELAVLRRLHDLAGAYGLSGEGWEDYAAALAEARSGSLQGSPVVDGFPDTPDHWVFGWVAAVGAYDPLPWWKQVAVPALLVYGGLDERLDVEKSVALAQSALAGTELRWTLVLHGRNGHALFRDDLLDFTARWIRDGGVD